MPNDKAQMSNQAQNPDQCQTAKLQCRIKHRILSNAKRQSSNEKEVCFWHLGIWISIVIGILTFGFVQFSPFDF